MAAMQGKGVQADDPFYIPPPEISGDEPVEPPPEIITEDPEYARASDPYQLIAGEDLSIELVGG